MRTRPNPRIRRFLRSMETVIRQDWGLLLVALAVAFVFWWDVTKNRMVTRYFPNVEVRLMDLDPSLKKAKEMIDPKVGVTVSGPRILQDLDSTDFIMLADLSDIRDATTYEIPLSPKNFKPLAVGLSADNLRVKEEDITPGKIPVITEWNSWPARVLPRYSGEPANGYVISSTWVSPATMMLAGSDADRPLHLVVRNKNELVLNQESRTIERVWTVNDLDLGNTRILGDPNPTVRFVINIEPKFRKRSVKQVPIRVIDPNRILALDERRYSITPTGLDVMLQGPRSKLFSLDIEALAMELDLSEVRSGDSEYPWNRLKPVLPQDVQILDATPKSVTVWLEQMDDQGPVRDGLLPMPYPYPTNVIQPATAEVTTATTIEPASATVTTPATSESKP